jgi:hypothetical protein
VLRGANYRQLALDSYLTPATAVSQNQRQPALLRSGGWKMMPERTETGARGRRRSIVRTVTVGGKFTEAEAKALAKQAAQRGQLLGEWAREILLSASREQTRDVEGIALFAEVQAVRLVLINTLEPLLRGEKMNTEQFKEMLRYLKANKRRAAAELMESYREGIGE